KEGKHEPALDRYAAAAAMDSARTDAPFQQGLLLYALGRIDEAGVAFQETLRRGSELSTPWCNLALCRLRQGHGENALACLDRAVGLDPKSAPAWSNRSNVLAELGRPVDALDSADRALALDPDCSDGWGNRGRALAMQGRVEEALHAFEKGCQLKPADA